VRECITLVDSSRWLCTRSDEKFKCSSRTAFERNVNLLYGDNKTVPLRCKYSKWVLPNTCQRTSATCDSAIVSNCVIIPPYNDTVSIRLGYSGSNMTRGKCVEQDGCGKESIFAFFKDASSRGDRSNAVVKVLCYKSECPWFDPKWCQWIFH